MLVACEEIVPLHLPHVNIKLGEHVSSASEIMECLVFLCNASVSVKYHGVAMRTPVSETVMPIPETVVPVPAVVEERAPLYERRSMKWGSPTPALHLAD